MSDLKAELIRMGTAKPELRADLKPVIASLHKQAQGSTTAALTLSRSLSARDGGYSVSLLIRHDFGAEVDYQLVNVRGRELRGVAANILTALSRASGRRVSPDDIHSGVVSAYNGKVFLDESFAFAPVSGVVSDEEIQAIVRQYVGSKLTVRYI